jgi:hypothetical protein
MAAITTITGAAWPTSGAASTATTGFNICTGLTHVGSTDIPAGSAATGYLTSAADTSCDFRIDATASVIPNVGDTYWVKFWARFVRTATSLPATGTLSGMITGPVVSIETRYEANIRSGEGLWTVLGGVTPISQTRPLGPNYTGPIIAYGEWVEMAFQVYRHATAGRYGIYVNGALAIAVENADTSTSPFTNWRVYLGHAGITTQICGPIRSCNDTDATIKAGTGAITIAPQDVADDDIQLWALPGVLNRAGGWWDTSSGTAANATVAVYASGGFVPNTYRYSIAAADELRMSRNVGTLTYNARGWANFIFTGIYVPTGTLSLKVMNAANTAALVQVDIASAELRQNGAKLADLLTTKRYQVIIHLSSTGAAKYTLHNITDDFATGTVTVRTGALANWTPGTVGQVRMDAAPGATPIQVEGVGILKRFHACAFDSYTAGAYATVSPTMISTNHIWESLIGSSSAGQLSYADLWCGTQKGSPFRYDGSNGTAIFPRTYIAVFGRSGNSLKNWSDNVLAITTHLRGCRFCFAPSVNDLGGTSAFASDAARDAKVAEVSGYIEAFTEQLIAGGNEVLLYTMPRLEGTSYDASKIVAINLLNAEVRRIARERQTSDGLITLSDPAALTADHDSLFATGDGVHMINAGDLAYALAMVKGVTTPAVPFPTAANVRLGTDRGNGENGTLAVPGAAYVAYGVAVDNTTGTAILDAASVRSAIGMAAANLDTQIATLATGTALTTLSNKIGTPAGASVSADIAGIAGGSGLTLTAAGIADAVCDEALSEHTTAGTVGKAIADIETGVEAIPPADTGDGDVLVDHNYGGTDELLVEDDDGNAIDGATIRAVTQADYDNGNPYNINGKTTTGADGRWVAPLMLNPDDYYLVISKPQSIETKLVELTVVASS